MPIRTTDLDRIAVSAPMNRTAAVVTGQGSTDAPEDSRSEKHRNLVRLIHQVERALKLTDDPLKRQKLGQQKLRIQAAITAEGKKPRRPKLPSIFMESAREMLTPALFSTIMKDAVNRYDEAVAKMPEAD